MRITRADGGNCCDCLHSSANLCKRDRTRTANRASESAAHFPPMLPPSRHLIACLCPQVMGRVGAYRALAKHQRCDPRALDERLRPLLDGHLSTADARLAAARQRQRGLMEMEALCGQLDAMRPLADLPDTAAPRDFPRPARGSDRMVGPLQGERGSFGGRGVQWGSKSVGKCMAAAHSTAQDTRHGGPEIWHNGVGALCAGPQRSGIDDATCGRSDSGSLR